MADNSEIIVGGGQAITPDQATIDELVEKLRQKLIARGMDPNRIQQLTDKYRNYLPSWLTLTHKYITLYPLPTGNADYNRDYDTIYTDEPVFEEVNWSAVDYPEERPDEYRFSRRLSNMYHHKTHIDNPPMYKFEDINESVTEEELHWTFNEETGEYEQVPRDMVYKADATGIIDRYDQSTSFRLATYNHNDDIRKIFFLEIIWGYSGWEWHDYERVIGTDPETEEDITETLKGGNLYTIKTIETVPHIIDGHRLQHVNDLLNSETSVTRVEGFNTVNLIAANRAFKRINLVRKWNDVLECHFVEGYTQDGDFGNHPFGYVDPVTGESLLENLEEADGLFYNNKVYMYEGDFANVIPFTIPNIESIDRFYSYGAYTPNLRFKMPNLKVFTNGFKMAMFNTATVNFNNILVDGTLDNLVDLSGLAAGVSIYDTNSDISTIKLDLTDSNVPAATEINLSHFAEWAGPREDTTNNIVTGSILNIDLDFKNKVDLSYAFSNILRGKNTSYDGISNIRNGGYERISINFHSKENLINSIAYALTNNTFIEANPIQSRPNADCNDDYVYYQSVFNDDISYDFSPTQSISYYYSQFNGANIKTGFTFTNLDCLKSIDFRNTKFPVDNTDPNNPVYTTFPYVLNNPNYTYNQDGSRYQNIGFEGSNLAGFAVQDFYLKLGDSNTSNEEERDRKLDREWAVISNRCFRNMPNVDFAYNHTSNYTSQYNLYIEDVVLGQINRASDYFITVFENCPNMTVTPNVYGNFNVFGNNKNSRVTFPLTSCNSLVALNCENLTIGRNRGWVNSTINITSTNLVYCRLGNCCCNLIIASENLDIPTFVATLLRQDRSSYGVNDAKPDLTIKTAVANGIQDYDTTHGTNVWQHCLDAYRNVYTN